MSNHHWTWKTADKGFRVVCADCGLSDKWYEDEALANMRVRELQLQGRGSKTVQHLNAIAPKLGSARRARKARAAQRVQGRVARIVQQTIDARAVQEFAQELRAEDVSVGTSIVVVRDGEIIRAVEDYKL